MLALTLALTLTLTLTLTLALTLTLTLTLPRGYREQATFSTVVQIVPGIHQYKFIVDGVWRCAQVR